MKALRDITPVSMPPLGMPGVLPRPGSLGGLAGRALDLRELRYFQSVGRTGNFGRAARELNISQPTVTSQVQKLEEGLGTQLLIRHGRGVTLTQAGSCLMERIDAIMGLLNAPLEQAPAPEQTIGSISLALPVEAAPLLVPHLMEACAARWPNVSLAIREGSSASLEEWVLDRRADIALLQDPPTLDRLDIQPIATERLGLVSCVRSPSGDGPASIRDLIGLRLILPRQGHWVRRVVETAAFRRGVPLDQVRQVDGVLLTKEMVRNGLGSTVLPLAAVREDVARGSLTYRPFDREPLTVVHAIASRAGEGPDPFVSDVRRLAQDVIRGLAADGTWAGVTAIPVRTPEADGSSEREATPG